MKLNNTYNGRYVEGAGGTKLFVEENGDPTRPTILWIHGYCQSRLSWDKQFENKELASKFHMVRLDLRGHGLSDKPTDPAVFQDSKIWADDIQAVISSLRLNKPILAGWSYGGFIICDYIRHYGQTNLGGIIFVAAATEIGRDEANALLGADFLQLVPGFFSTDYAEGSTALQQFMGMATYEELDPHTFYYLVGFNSMTLPASRQGMFMRELDNGALMKTITVPSLIVQGKDDRIVLPASSDNIARHVSHISRVDYDHCGHVPFVEAAEQFNRDVATLMERVHL
ncbi:MAG: alpha/beta fold hydrolase [Ktedonobacteraceae bacterium]